jgi:hypothetical protein
MELRDVQKLRGRPVVLLCCNTRSEDQTRNISLGEKEQNYENQMASFTGSGPVGRCGV